MGHISGGHFNPAVSLGLWAAGRFPGKDLGPYILIQVVGGLVAGVVLYLIATGKAGVEVGGFASNGYGERSPGGYGMGAAFLTEVVMTLFFLVVILGVTSKAAPAGFAPIAIGLCLTLIHLISIPVTNTSVNPARSTGVAFFADAGAVPQLWLFWLAPIIGALIAGYLTRCSHGVPIVDQRAGLLNAGRVSSRPKPAGKDSLWFFRYRPVCERWTRRSARCTRRQITHCQAGCGIFPASFSMGFNPRLTVDREVEQGGFFGLLGPL